MGLGTALNAYLSYEWSKKNHIDVWYCGVEAYPVDGELITTCLTEIGVDKQDVLSFFSSLSYGETKTLEYFTLAPIHTFWADLSMEDSFDIIFYDELEGHYINHGEDEVKVHKITIVEKKRA